MGKSPMPWFAMLPLGTLIVLASSEQRDISPDLFVGALIVAASCILCAWGVLTILGGIFEGIWK